MLYANLLTVNSRIVHFCWVPKKARGWSQTKKKLFTVSCQPHIIPWKLLFYIVYAGKNKQTDFYFSLLKFWSRPWISEVKHGFEFWFWIINYSCYSYRSVSLPGVQCMIPRSTNSEMARTPQSHTDNVGSLWPL